MAETAFAVALALRPLMRDHRRCHCFLIMGNEVEAEPANLDGLGLRGNQSGPLVVTTRPYRMSALTRSKMTHLRHEGKEREYTTRPCRRC
jgi:hypothetical protein